MSNTSESNNKPDYVFNHIDRREHGPDKWTNLGAGWRNDKGYINVKSPVYGDFILQPREELERLRNEQQAAQSQTQDVTQQQTQEIAPAPEVTQKP